MISVSKLALAILVATIPACDSQNPNNDNQAPKVNLSNSTESDLTLLSRKAGRLQMGMSRSEVIRQLGPPDWVITPADTNKDWKCAPGITLNLAWRNGSHYPVVVDFTGNYTVIGWDEGQQEMPVTNSEHRLPPSSLSATQPGRNLLAKP